MSPSQSKATIRMVVASFAAGAGAMVMLGLVAPVAMKGGLSMRDAFADQVVQQAPVIEPLDVAAIEAQLAEADRLMAAARETTDDNVGRLEALAN
ncbi:MAG: hypothetical protein A4S17_11070 [Proteobacteria bacterium HN_bin10]|jgi:hypothetical protein|nr:MAG: hypothetical protein A4S17_11070 [Proteobacteria bacterium HN_bin10]